MGKLRPLVAFAVMALVAGVEIWRLQGPEVQATDAPAGAFSAVRALKAMRAALVDAPHPVGSPMHDVVRDRLTETFTNLGYQVEHQKAFVCDASAWCGDGDNLIATRPGAPAGKAVVVSAHYDSVPAGPGASDNGTGVATALEVARAIKHDALARPVVFLINDGEEAGYFGSEAFMRDERSRDAAFFVNLDARGTTGAPYLFETSRNNGWLIPIVAGALPRPVTSSLFATIYDLLPNGTDLTVYKRAGKAGINFAYLGGGAQYHTPLDDYAHVDATSVQWRGDQVLAMVRAFGASELETAPQGDAVWFDVLAFRILWWPAGWSLWLGIAAFAICVVAVLLGRRRGQVTAAGLVLGVLGFVGTVVGAYAAGTALVRLMAMRPPGAMFEPHPQPMIASAWLLGVVAALAVAQLARKWASFDSVLLGAGLTWSALAIALAIVLPGATYVAVVPALAVALVALARGLGAGELVCVLATAAAAVVLFPFGLAVYESLGAGSMAATAVLIGLAATTCAPMITSTRALLAVLVPAVALAGVALIMPTAAPSHPVHVSVTHVGEDRGARWQISKQTPLVAAAAPWEERLVQPWYGGVRGVELVAPAPSLGLPAPTATVVRTERDGNQVTTIDVTSVRGAPWLALNWRGGGELVELRINGSALPPRPARFHSYLADGWHRVVVNRPSAQIELVTRGAAPAEGILYDHSYGAPALARGLQTVRDADGAVPVHDGDSTVVETRVTW